MRFSQLWPSSTVAVGLMLLNANSCVTPVLSDAEFERASEEIRTITNEAGQPVLASGPLGARPPSCGGSQASASRAA